MSLDPKLNGDVTKIEGTLIVSVLSDKQEVIGLYALTPKDGTYLRGARTWIEAKGPALMRLHDKQLVEQKPSFIDTFDRMDASGTLPSLDDVIAGSTSGRPGSWDTQN